MQPDLTYTSEESSLVIRTDEFVRRFHRPEKFAESCRVCTNFGKSWTCPPFEESQKSFFHNYRKLLLIATKVIPHSLKIPFDESRKLLRPERIRLQNRLIEMEKKTGGISVSYVGECLYCLGSKCTRIQNEGCRHPEKVRTSLEALGFDVIGAAKELFGIEILWSNDGFIPNYLVLVSGLFILPKVRV